MPINMRDDFSTAESMTTPVINDEASWKKARAYADRIGSMPAVFGAAVRLLIADQQQKDRSLRPVTKFLVSQALRGRKILSMLYYATSLLSPDQISARERVSLGDLISLYQPYDLATLYALYLIHRRTIKAFDIDRAGSHFLTPGLRRESQLGGIVGASIPSIGVGNGLLAGSLHHLAIAMIAASEPSLVGDYYQHLEQSGCRWDFYREAELFGCTSLQIGAALLAKVGFGKANVEAYVGALDPELRLSDSTGNQLSIRYGRFWVEGLLAGREQPLTVMPGEYYPLLENRQWMEEQAALVKDDSVSWIERDKTDVSEALTPLLFREDHLNKEVPEQLRDIFSLKEITQMEEEEFDDLIDHIDRSLEDKH